ncbi:MAG: cyclic nucleotide-binding domain-containing protein [Desulfobacterales bacterium]|nr:cyclic nucleotide-binding domain-containing protein [Desulfobacterales bacterium]
MTLEASKIELENAIENLKTTKITTGVFWVQVPEAGLFILCGCPAEIVKHLMIKGYISSEKKGNVFCETGPNAILLSDVLIQNGGFSNLAEFPVLQMLYRQGLILPNHPNNTGKKPLLIGSREQVKAQMNYIYRGNYGLISRQEIMDTGIQEELADEMMRIKMKFAFGKMLTTEELLDSIVVENEPVEIRKGVFIKRTGFNKYEFIYKGKTTRVDLNLAPEQTYESPYSLGFHNIKREYFAVIHSGEGDGWDTKRPSMGSILMYQGNIYLIDAAPHILHTLRSLGIDISEVEGIFHTHTHDDHFASLPTLIQSDHRIKYFATPFVRESVTKKFSALMSMDESLFATFFDIRDLEFDKWNDCDGLEVKPLYSPHPVETNIFLFRAICEGGYKTYAHFADIISLNLLKKMALDDTYNLVKNNYLIPVDLKKIDIGAGMIHGEAKDFKEDNSDKIVLAHTSLQLTNDQKEIGSESSFGTTDVLISHPQDYSRVLAYNYLSSFFLTLPIASLKILTNASKVSFNPGTIILKKGDMPKDLYLILTGSVEYIGLESEFRCNLSNGCFIGEYSFFGNIESQVTYRTVSHVTSLRFSTSFFKSFLEKNNIYETTKKIFENIRFLQTTWLFGEGNSYSVQNKIAQVMSSESFDGDINIYESGSPTLFLIKEGEIKITNSKNETIEKLKNGDFFGEHTFFSEDFNEFKFVTIKPSILYLISDPFLLDIPIVHWKLLEIYSKRIKQLETLT